LIAFTYFMVLIFKNIPHLIRRISWGWNVPGWQCDQEYSQRSK
jgi:hypothetical protein